MRDNASSYHPAATSGNILWWVVAMRTFNSALSHHKLDAIGPGANARDIDYAARSALKRRKFGKEFKHSTGYGVGFAAANPNAIPRIHPASPDVLREGMTFNIEPAIYFDGYGGMRHCDMVGVGKTGAEVFTNF
jgi:Xaa-Pro aminopeptidase